MSDPQVEDDRSGAKGGNEDLRGLPTPPVRGAHYCRCCSF